MTIGFHSQPPPFTRSTQGIPRSVIEKSAAAKVKVEKFYEELVKQSNDRKNRYFVKDIDIFE